jgi:hypothetical protein
MAFNQEGGSKRGPKRRLCVCEKADCFEVFHSEYCFPPREALARFAIVLRPAALKVIFSMQLFPSPALGVCLCFYLFLWLSPRLLLLRYLKFFFLPLLAQPIKSRGKTD